MQGCLVLLTSILLLANSSALAADVFEEVCWRWRAVDLINFLVDTRHAANTTASKDECLVIRDLIHNVEAAKLNPPTNWSAMVYCNDIGSKAVNEFFRLHPRKIRHIFATLKS